MHFNNKGIRAHARYLLDDNILGKDWIKGACTHIMIDFIIGLLAYLLYATFIINLIILFFTIFLTNSVILAYFLATMALLAIPLSLSVIIGPISVGIASVYIDLVRGNGQIKIRKFFCGFRNFFSNAVLAVMCIVQVALWSFFFIIPGIYVAYSYALVFHVKKDNPNYRWKQCLDESERLMEGNRWNLFKLQVSHIGWFLLGLAFILVGSYWAMPYYHTSIALFYDQVRFEKGIR